MSDIDCTCGIFDDSYPDTNPNPDCPEHGDGGQPMVTISLPTLFALLNSTYSSPEKLDDHTINNLEDDMYGSGRPGV